MGWSFNLLTEKIHSKKLPHTMVEFDHLKHGFSNCGTRTTTGTPTIVYWYAALIKKSKYKKG
jgi:hypothetical protein